MGNVIHTLERRRENVKVADGQTYGKMAAAGIF